MEQVWLDSSPHARFWRNLLNGRVDELVKSKAWLQSLRYNNQEVKWWLKKCGHIFDERGLNLYELIAQSYDECWDLDEYDEETFEREWARKKDEKVVLPIVKEKPRQDAISLDHPREVGVCSQEEEKSFVQVRPSDERRKGELQKEGVKVV